jgi:hypothetical protein
VLMTCLVSPAQRIVLLGADFDFMRIMTLLGWLRLILRSEYGKFQSAPLDRWVLVFMACNCVMNVVQEMSVQALINRTGWFVEAAGLYFLLRHFLQSREDLFRMVKTFTVVGIPVAIAFLIERATGRNAFAIFGGVPAITVVRDGRLRCTGAFAHPIVAGCFWAALLPIFVAHWWAGHKGKTVAVVGTACTLIVIFCCSSSTPVMAVIFALLGVGFVLVRRYLGWVRLGTVLMLIGLHLSMSKPVWHLVARIDVVSGSTGYHRYLLMDAAITHFSEWFLVGIPFTSHWGDGMEDITNQYIAEGVKGGFLSLILFIMVIAKAFGSIGRAWRLAEWHKPSFVLMWAIGVSMFVHCTSFLALTYFGQANTVWYITLALAAAAPKLVAPRPSAATDAPRPRTRPSSGRDPRFAYGRQQDVGQVAT